RATGKTTPIQHHGPREVSGRAIEGLALQSRLNHARTPQGRSPHRSGYNPVLVSRAPQGRRRGLDLLCLMGAASMTLRRQLKPDRSSRGRLLLRAAVLLAVAL